MTYLNTSAAPEPCDSIFVLAGKQERKLHGIELWRAGCAPELILSVGRFEWRRFYSLGLPDGGLRRLVEATPPVERHFFVRLRQDETVSIPVRRGRLGTLTEAVGAAGLLRGGQARRLMIVSSPIHLRRVSLAFRHAFRGNDVELVFVSAPGEASRSEVLTEFWKYLGYRVLLLFV